MPFEPGHILITGAAGAIGGALAEVFAERYPAARQTLVDRPGCGGTSGAGGADTAWVECDLTALDVLPDWYREVVGRRGAVDLLVNCAGVMDIFSFAGTPWERGRLLLDINLVAPLRLMDLALPAMIANRQGGVINIASMAGRVPIKGCSYYGAAKAGIGNASEIARLDHAGDGVEVITVYPGPIHSGLESHARSQVRPGLVSRHIPTGSPKALAARIARAFAKGEARVIYPDVYGAINHVANLALTSWLLGRISPQPNQ